MDAAMPLSLNGLYEGFTWWWWCMFLMRDRCEKESPDERVEHVRSKSEDSGSLLGSEGGTGVEHVGLLHGASRR